jgi:hypothetical protein
MKQELARLERKEEPRFGTLRSWLGRLGDLSQMPAS